MSKRKTLFMETTEVEPGKTAAEIIRQMVCAGEISTNDARREILRRESPEVAA